MCPFRQPVVALVRLTLSTDRLWGARHCRTLSRSGAVCWRGRSKDEPLGEGMRSKSGVATGGRRGKTQDKEWIRRRAGKPVVSYGVSILDGPGPRGMRMGSAKVSE